MVIAPLHCLVCLFFFSERLSSKPPKLGCYDNKNSKNLWGDWKTFDILLLSAQIIRDSEKELFMPLHRWWQLNVGAKTLKDVLLTLSMFYLKAFFAITIQKRQIILCGIGGFDMKHNIILFNEDQRYRIWLKMPGCESLAEVIMMWQCWNIRGGKKSLFVHRNTYCMCLLSVFSHLEVASLIPFSLSCGVCIVPEGWDLGWNRCWAPVRWLTRATTTRTSPATPLLPSLAHWQTPSSLHQARNHHNCLLNCHVSRRTRARSLFPEESLASAHRIFTLI